MTIGKISEVLSRCGKATYWSILGSEEENRVFYFVLDRPSQSNLIREKKNITTLYNVHGDDLGVSTEIIIGEPAKGYESIIDSLVQKAESQKNPLFEFPLPIGSYAEVPLSDPEISDASLENITNRIRSLSEEMSREALEKRVSIPRVEVYVVRGENHFLSKSGIDLTEPETRVILEFEILYNEKDRKGSYAPTVSCRKFEDISPKNLVNMYAPYAEHSACAEKSITHKGPVILTGDALLDFFTPPIEENALETHPLYLHSSAQMKYNKKSSFDVGKSICGDDIKGERITIVSNPHIPFGIKSKSFSRYDGLPAMEFPLVEESKLKNFHGDKRFSDYLRLDRKGPIGNIVVSQGEHMFSDLLEDGVPVIEAFSSFQSNETGNLGLEIRVGYIFKGGGKIPIKGGLLMGNYFEVLSNMHLSKETLVSTGYGYKGPQAIRFENLEICER
jgi:predicted Zn-dependent protease